MAATDPLHVAAGLVSLSLPSDMLNGLYGMVQLIRPHSFRGHFTFTFSIVKYRKPVTFSHFSVFMDLLSP
jgi:hypothetical protein